MSREIEIYKATRTTVSVAAAALLTRQAEAEGGPPWDVLQESTAAHDQVVLNAVQSDSGRQSFAVKPDGLDAATMYHVQSVDAGALGMRPARR